jgi:membrane-associated phospholipid phosphatase
VRKQTFSGTLKKLIILTFLIAVGLVVTFSVDEPLRQIIRDLQIPAVFTFMKWLTRMGDTWLLLVLALCLLAWGYWLKRPAMKTAGGVGVGALAISNSAVEVLKRLIGRPRPGIVENGDFDWGPSLEAGHDSFPSAHANSGFAIAVVLSSLYPRWRGIWYGAAGLAALTRIYLDVHFVSDVFAGAVVGVVTSRMLLRFVKRNSETFGVSGVLFKS